MALPILVTVAGLGVGWVALSRARAQMPTGHAAGHRGSSSSVDAVSGASELVAAAGSPGVATLGGTPVAAGPEGGSPQASCDGLSAQVDDERTTGADPSTSPPPSSAPGSMIGGATMGPTTTPTPTPTRAPLIMTAKYGVTAGVTMRQQSVTLAEYGPLTGEVW